MKRLFIKTLLLVLLIIASTALRAQNVGIGTNSPTQKLDVNGNLRVRGLQNAASGKTMVMTDSAGNITAANLNALATQNSSAPAVLGNTTSPNPVGNTVTSVTIAAAGSTAYVISRRASSQPGTLPRNLDIYNCSDPATPVLQSTTLVGSTPSDLAIAGSTIYITNGGADSLQIFNCSNPAAPQLLGTVATGPQPRYVCISGTTAYVANNGNKTVQVFNVANPASPSLMATFTGWNAGNISEMELSGSSLYLLIEDGNNPGQLQIINCTSPANPVLQSSTTITTHPTDLKVAGSRAYVCGPLLQIFNVANPASPALMGSYSFSPLSISLAGTSVYYGSTQLSVLDCSNPAAIVLGPSVDIVSEPIRTLTISGNYCYGIQYNINLPYRLQLFQLAATSVLGLGVDGNIVNLPIGKFGDNLGTHTATQNINLSTYKLTGSNVSAGLSIAGDGMVTTDGPVNLGSNQLVGQSGTSGIAILNSGNVGIGTTTPTQRLDVNGNVTVAGNASFGGNITALGNLVVSGTASIDSIAQDAVQAPPVLINNWSNYGFGFANAGFYKDKEGIVRLSGLITGGSISANSQIFILPAGYRPSSGRLIFTVDHSGSVGRVDILANGEVRLMTAGSNTYLNLTGISFRAD
jgi:hypothetical protein